MSPGVKVVRWSALLLILVASVAYAGQATSSISGVVVDSAGGFVPGATVTVTGPNGTKFDVISNSAGAFNVPALQPGTYSVTRGAPGIQDRGHHRCSRAPPACPRTSRPLSKSAASRRR